MLIFSLLSVYNEIAVIEYARNVCGLQSANSEEFDAATPDKVVIFMPEIDKTQMGGTMRLGSRETKFKVDPRVHSDTDCQDTAFILPQLYQKLWNSNDSVMERHRHRFALESIILAQF